MYKLRNEKFTYYDVFKETTPLLSKVTKHKLFTFNQKVIDQFRCQLGTLIENLSHVYKHNRLPNTEILTADTEDTSSNYFTQYTLQDLTQDDLTQEDLLLLTTSPFKESAQKKGEAVNAAGEKKGDGVNVAGGINLAGDIDSSFGSASDGSRNATEKGVAVKAADAIDSAIGSDVDGSRIAMEKDDAVEATGAIDSAIGSDVDGSRSAMEKGDAVEAAGAIDSAVHGIIDAKQKTNVANAECDAVEAIGGTVNRIDLAGAIDSTQLGKAVNESVGGMESSKVKQKRRKRQPNQPNNAEDSSEAPLKKGRHAAKTKTADGGASKTTRAKKETELAEVGAGNTKAAKKVTTMTEGGAATMKDTSPIPSDPFVGKPVAFTCNSEFGKILIKEFGKKWVDEAVCYHLDPKVGHLVGTVMRKSRGLGRNHGKQINYDVVWEFSHLGETNVPYCYLLEGNKMAEKLLKRRAKMKRCPESSSRKNRTITIDKIKQLRENLCTVSEDEEEMMVSNNL